MSNLLLLITIGLAILAAISGMLGLGVAFAAVPFLSIFFDDLVNQVQPLTLLLNGVTAGFAALGFAQSGYVDWRKAGLFALATTMAAPVGSYLAQFIPANILWAIFGLCVVVLLYQLLRPVREGAARQENLRLALSVTVVIAIVASLMGMGPGFLLVPALIGLGFEAKRAAAINAVAATPASFSALIPRLPALQQIDPTLTIILLVAGAGGAFLGARISSTYVSEKWLKLLFASVVLLLTGYRFYTLV